MGHKKDRGRDDACAPPLPPNRTGEFPASGSPVSELCVEHGSLALGVRLRRLIRGPRSRHWASVDGLDRGHARVVYVVYAPWCAIVGVSIGPPLEKCWRCYVGSSQT